ncbi:MAG: 4Fe-4S binding protein [Clostridia bacterium]
MKGTYRPSVALIENRCVGCTTCIKRCPTEAIRVRSGRARILSDLCIDCRNVHSCMPPRGKGCCDEAAGRDLSHLL